MVEVLIALVIVAVGLAAIGSVFGTIVRGAHALENRVALIETARLLSVRMYQPLATRGADDLQGEVFGHRWQIGLSPFAGGPYMPSSQWLPQQVELRVRSPTGATVSLQTVRLARRASR